MIDEEENINEEEMIGEEKTEGYERKDGKVMQNKQLKKYVLNEDIYFDDSEGINIFDQEYNLTDVFEIVNNKLVIKQHIKEKFGLCDDDGLKAVIFTAFSMIIWEEEYIINDYGLEYTVFVGKDLDEEDYYTIKVRTSSMYQKDNDGNGGTFNYEADEPFKQIVKRYEDDLKANKEYLFNELYSLQDGIRESIMKFKDKPKFRKRADD